MNIGIPNFFIVGFPKCGTTSMVKYLSQHPQVFVPSHKEPGYFSPDIAPSIYKTKSEYLALYQDFANKIILIDASTKYSHSSIAYQTIKEFNPNSKVLVMLRNPVDIVYAFHSELVKLGIETETDFSIAWRIQSQRVNGDLIPANCKEFRLMYEYESVGRIGQSLQRAFEIFGRKNVHVILFDDFVAEPHNEYRKLLEFLSIQNHENLTFPIENANTHFSAPRLAMFVRELRLITQPFWIAIKKLLRIKSLGILYFLDSFYTYPARRPPLTPPFRKNLQKLYEPEIELVERLIHRDLSLWKQAHTNDTFSVNTVNCLILSEEYPPDRGGVSTCAVELERHLEADNQIKTFVVSRQKKTSTRDRHSDITLSRCSFLILCFRTILFGNYTTVIAIKWFPEGLIAILTRIFRSNIKVIIYCHGVELFESHSNFKKILRSFFQPIKSWALRNADHIIAVSEFTANKVRSITKKSANISIIHNGVSTESFIVLDTLQRNCARKIKILTVSRLVPHKNIDSVIRALTLLSNDIDFSYTVVGSGPELEPLKELALNSGLCDMVEFKTDINDNQLDTEYHNADLFILCSKFIKKIPAVEGFGIVFLEAAAKGLPSIGGQSGGIPEAIIHEKTGLLVDPDDIVQIASAIRKLSTDHKTRFEMGMRAYKRARSEFTWEKSCEELRKKIID